MKQSRHLASFFLKSNIFIAMCSIAMVLTGRLLLSHAQLHFPHALVVAVGCATFIIYNLTQLLINERVARFKQPPSGLDLTQNNAIIRLLLLICSVALLTSLFFLRWQVITVLAFLGVLSLLYNIPDQYLHRGYQSIRSIPLLKIFVIAFVWASIGSWLPYYCASGQWQQGLWLFWAQFCFIMAITLPFDIRDYRQDESSRLLTIPGIIGIRNTRWLAICFLLLHLVIMLMFFGHTLVPTLLLVAASGPLLVYAHCDRPYWYFTGLLDGLILLQYLLLLVLV